MFLKVSLPPYPFFPLPMARLIVTAPGAAE
jgi:hypothetical protein